LRKYVITKCPTIVETVCSSELVGYDWETGEEEYEDCYDIRLDYHEKTLETFDSYEEAANRYEQLCKAFEEANRWPLNEPHYRFMNGSVITEYTDNEDLVIFTLREEES